jgi:hypothetical protein
MLLSDTSGQFDRKVAPVVIAATQRARDYVMERYPGQHPLFVDRLPGLGDMIQTFLGQEGGDVRPYGTLVIDVKGAPEGAPVTIEIDELGTTHVLKTDANGRVVFPQTQEMKGKPLHIQVDHQWMRENGYVAVSEMPIRKTANTSELMITMEIKRDLTLVPAFPYVVVGVAILAIGLYLILKK